MSDCIDCHRCVNVCPTGIDIRNGTQAECVNWYARRIDACDNIGRTMCRISEKDLFAEQARTISRTRSGSGFTARIIGYIAVLLVLLTTLITCWCFAPMWKRPCCGHLDKCTSS